LCKIYIAALVSEFLFQKNKKKGVPPSSLSFKRMAPNIMQEKGLSIISLEGGSFGSTEFSEEGLLEVLHEAIAYFSKALIHESALEALNLAIQIYKEIKKYDKLEYCGQELSRVAREIGKAVGPHFFYLSVLKKPSK